MSSVWSSSGEAARYSSARPEHPLALVETAVGFLKEKYPGPLHSALDVGCGTGISTRNLCGHFEHVLGTDISEAMVCQANEDSKMRPAGGGLKFLVAPAERIPLDRCSCQLILVGRAIHYFDQANFFKEVDRVLVPGGLLAYYSVHFPNILVPGDEDKSKKVDEIFWEYMNGEALDKFWPVNAYDGCQIGSTNRRDYYVNKIKSPYNEKRLDESISYDRDVTLDTLVQELSSYSALVSLREAMGDREADRLLQEFLERVYDVLGTRDGGVGLVTRNRFFLVMTRKPVD